MIDKIDREALRRDSQRDLGADRIGDPGGRVEGDPRCPGWGFRMDVDAAH